MKPLDCSALTAQIGRSRCLYSTSLEADFALLRTVRCTSISTVKDSVADTAEQALTEYRRKRDFNQTPEPSGDPIGRADEDRSAWDLLPHGHRFCVQKHRATRMHFDFRLEHEGVLLSWAIPRGPTLDPAKKRLAVQTEDHPIDYGEFEGVIPSGYGAGTVMLWDIGTFEWIKESAADYERSFLKGDIKFRLDGSKLSGEFALVHIGERGKQYGGSSDGTKNWLMLKKRDSSVVEGYEAIDRDVSVKTGRSLADIAGAGGGDPRELRRARARGETPPPLPDTAPMEPARAPSPMLASPSERAFSREGWLFELKYDGIRAMVSVAGDAVRITGRRGNDETFRYPEAQAIRAGIRARQAIVDGELVVLDAEGRPSFERLQQRINITRETDARRLAAEHPVTYVAFDLLQLEGRDLMTTELRIRKKTLRETIVDAPHILFAAHVERDGVALFEEARKSGIEGIVAKRADSLYRPGIRTPEWVKIKSWSSQSCVIAGYTAGRGKRSNQLGALILAILDNGRLVHCGQVGTGFDDKTLRDLKDRLAPLVVDKCPLDTTPKTAEPATWVKPEIVCEVRFSEWTNEGMLRHPAYQKLRLDQTKEDTTREPTKTLPQATETHPASRKSVERAPEDSGHEIMPAAQSPADNAPSGSGAKRSSPHTSRLRPSPETISAKGSPGGSVGSSVAGVLGDEEAQPSRKTDKPKETKRGGDEGPPPRQDPDTIESALKTLRTLHGNARWEIAGRRLPLTNLDKVLWPADGLTKRDMIEHYVRMAPYMLPYLRDRPLSMQVFPDGIDGKSFWRKDKPAHAPSWIDAWTYHGEKTKSYIVVNEVATLAWVANAGVIDLHPWHSRIDDPGAPDWAVFDLDPFEPATFQDVIDIAKLVKAALDHYGMHGVVKTSGQTGLQIYVPVRRGPDYAAVRNWVEEVGKAIDQAAPGRVSWEWAVAKRTGRIRIDYTQNIINKTLAAPYSLRPAQGAPVSTPIAWEELDDPELRPDRWTIATIGKRIDEVGDLFAPVLDADQDLPS
jgi:bifunctional non-homologous end joining protein LigD